MKKTLFIFVATFIILLFYNCTAKLKQPIEIDESVDINGKIAVINGKGEIDTVEYFCPNSKLLNKRSFEKIVNTSTEKVKKLMNYPRTFIPLKMDMLVNKKDSIFHYSTNEKLNGILEISTKYYYVAQNAYGTEIEGDTWVFFYTDTLGYVSYIDDLIKLPTLYKKGNGVSRNLTLYNDDGGYIDVSIDKKQLLITSSLSCVDEGTWLTFYLDNNENFHLSSWNRYNCDGYSFFYWFNKSQIELLKNHKVEFISVTDRKTVSCSLPKNKQDYFMQLVNLYNK